MKQEYKERTISNLENIAKRITILEEMNNGKRPADRVNADLSIQEIKRLLDVIYNIVDIS